MTVFIISQMIFFVSSFGCGEKIQMQPLKEILSKYHKLPQVFLRRKKKTLKIKQPVGFHDV